MFLVLWASLLWDRWRSPSPAPCSSRTISKAGSSCSGLTDVFGSLILGTMGFCSKQAVLSAPQHAGVQGGCHSLKKQVWNTDVPCCQPIVDKEYRDSLYYGVASKGVCGLKCELCLVFYLFLCISQIEVGLTRWQEGRDAVAMLCNRMQSCRVNC